MRLVVAALLLALLASLPVSAAPCSTNDSDPSLPPCTRLHAFHELDVSAAAGETALAGDVGALATESARADASYSLGFGDDIPFYSLDLAGGVTATRQDGSGVHASGGATRLSLYLGPATPPLDARYVQRSAAGFFPLDAAHEGELAALPALDSPADVARGTYSSEHVEAHTSFVRAVFVDQQPDQPVRPWAIDVGAGYAQLDATWQDQMRVATDWGVALAQFSSGRDVDVVMLGLENHATTIGTTSHDWQVAWPLRIDVRSPSTGTVYRIGYGITNLPWSSQQNVDLYAIGVGDARWGAGYERRPYITMAGEPALEDRFKSEAVLGGELHVVARAFAARTERVTVGGSSHVDWTCGLEGDGSRRVGPVDVGMRAELGRSFYAALDDAAPAASFGARASVTVSRATTRRFVR